MSDLLQAREVTVDYGGTRANDAVSLSVGSGQFIGLIDPNGAGKSTFPDPTTALPPPTPGPAPFPGPPVTARATRKAKR